MPPVVRAFILALLVATSAGAAPPNIVVVLVDDLRFDDLACCGHPFVRTPHIDRLAQEGARFTNAFAVTPLCSPSRASILTGQYTHRHGILDNTNRSAASHGLDTFPIHLQRAGYETSFIGKWHMGNDDSARPGFDRWIALPGQGTSFDPTLNVDGRRIQVKGYTTDVLNMYAVEFIRQKRDKPFCLFLAHKALHPETAQRDDGTLTDPGAENFLPAPRHADLYENDPIPRRANCDDPLVGKPALRREIPGLKPLSRATGTSDRTIRSRLRMLAAVDEGVGQLLASLADSAQLDRTVIVLLSDHGYWYGEHGLSVERRLAYEEGIRIPFLMRYPPLIEPGRTLAQIVLTIDLAPTLLELAGAKPLATCDGRSLVPLFAATPPADWRTAFLIEYNSDNVFPRTANLGYRALRTDRWKLIHYHELPDADELYDLHADPHELHNLIADPGHQRVRDTILAQLAKFE